MHPTSSVNICFEGRPGDLRALLGDDVRLFPNDNRDVCRAYISRVPVADLEGVFHGKK